MRRRVRRAAAITLDDLTIHDHLCLMSGWSPPKSEFDRGRSRWQTWAEFLHEFELLRTDLLKEFPRRSGEEYFAEKALRMRNAVGLAALESASYEEIKYGSDEEDNDDDVV